MAKLFFLSASILFLLSLCSHSVSSQTEKCDGVLLEMLPCLDYASIGSNLTAPTDICCSCLAKIVEANPTCLCDAANMAKGFNINVTRAEDLPKACNTNYNGSCNVADSPAPAPAPPSAPKSPVTPSSAPSPALSPEPTPTPPVVSPPSPPESHSGSAEGPSSSASGNIPPVQSPSGSAEGPASSASILELPSSLKFLLALALASFAFLAV